jgi:hypothetical protein
MADNVGYTPGTGATVAADEIAGALHQRMKLSIGEDGTAVDLSEANPMPTEAQRVEDLLVMMGRMLKILESNAVVDIAQRQRITLDAITTGLSLSTIIAVNNVANVANVAAQTAMAGMDREMYINIARQAYASSIRSQLQFT